MTARLIFAIVSTIIEEIAIVVIVLWGLPEIGVQIPVWGLILIMIAWLSYSVYTFREGTKALKTERVVGLPNMIGTRGKVINALKPEGMVRINGELWVAKSTSVDIESGAEIVVVGQQRLKLEVRNRNTPDNTEVME